MYALKRHYTGHAAMDQTDPSCVGLINNTGTMVGHSVVGAYLMLNTPARTNRGTRGPTTEVYGVRAPECK